MSLDKAVDRLRSLDFLAPEVKLNIGGKKGVKTLLGTSMTVIYMFGVIAAATLAIRTYMRTDNPISMSEVLQKDEYPMVNLAEQKLLPLIYAVEAESRMIPASEISKYMTLTVISQRWSNEYDPALGKTKLNYIIETFDVIPCGQLSPESLKIYDYIDPKSVMGQAMPVYALCIDHKFKLAIKGQASDDNFSFVTVKVAPCSLGTSDCKDLWTLSTVSIIFANSQTSYEQTNYLKPFQQTPNSDTYFYINPGLSQMANVIIKKNISNDYIGLFPKWTQTHEFFDIREVHSIGTYRDENSITCHPAVILDSKLCPSYINYVIKSSGTLLRVGRRYRTIFETFGEIGGINGILYMLLVFVYSRFNERYRRELLISKTFGFLSSDDIALAQPGSTENGRSRAEATPTRRKRVVASSKGTPADILNKKKETFREVSFVGGSTVLNARAAPNPGGTSSSRVRRLCNWGCFRKKTNEELILEDARRTALQCIESKLSVVNIVRSLNKLNVLADIVLRERHTKLVPYLELDSYRRYVQEKQQKAVNFGAGRGRIEDIDPEKVNHGQELGFSQAVDLVMKNSLSNNTVENLELEHITDQFFATKIKSHFESSLEKPDYLNPNSGVSSLLPLKYPLQAKREVGSSVENQPITTDRVPIPLEPNSAAKTTKSKNKVYIEPSTPNSYNQLPENKTPQSIPRASPNLFVTRNKIAITKVQKPQSLSESSLSGGKTPAKSLNQP
jgi:hypothetical protein